MSDSKTSSQSKKSTDSRKRSRSSTEGADVSPNKKLKSTEASSKTKKTSKDKTPKKVINDEPNDEDEPAVKPKKTKQKKQNKQDELAMHRQTVHNGNSVREVRQEYPDFDDDEDGDTDRQDVMDEDNPNDLVIDDDQGTVTYILTIQDEQPVDDSMNESQELHDDMPENPDDMFTERDHHFMKPLWTARKVLATLDKPYDQSNIDTLDERELYIQLEALEKLWVIPKEYQHDERIMDKITRRNLELKNDYSLTAVTDATYKCVLGMTKNLMLRFAQKMLINNPDYDQSDVNTSRFNKLMELQYLMLTRLHTTNKIMNYNQEKFKHEPSETINFLKFCMSSDMETTTFQKALFEVLKTLHDYGLRRFEDCVYEPICSRGNYTYAWRKVEKLEPYITNIFDIGSEIESFLKLTKNRTLTKQIADFLQQFDSIYFPMLRFNKVHYYCFLQYKNLYAFQNGLYYTRGDIFIPFDADKQNKDTLEDHQYQMEHAENEDEVSRPNFIPSLSSIKSSMKANNDIRNRHINSRNLDPTLAGTVNSNTSNNTAHKFFDIEYQDWRIKDNIQPRPYPEYYDRLPHAQRVKNIKAWNEKEENRAKQWKSADWRDIYTPHFDSIFESQHFKNDVKDWCYAVTGMSLYDGGELDNWQFLFLDMLAQARRCKSSWLKMIRELFELANVGILPNNVERQWALSSIYNKFVVLGYEVRKDFKWEQGEFQNCVTHEEVSIMIKHTTAFASPFVAPIYLAGNEMITSWEDNSGSLARRLLVIYFRHFIDRNKSDPNLHDKMMDEISDLLQKFNRAYLEFVALYGDKNFWSVAPKEFHDWNHEAMMATNALLDFLDRGNHYVFELSKEPELPPDQLWCKFSDFKEAFKLWHLKFYDRRPTIQLTKDNYDAPFSRMKIEMHKSHERAENGVKGGQRQRMDWLSGIAMIPDWKDQFKEQLEQGISLDVTNNLQERRSSSVQNKNQKTKSKSPE